MASKSKRRRKVLGASCILAALIIAGSSFAWFTSKDEVTNRLTASADYGVAIAEDFTPPENWIPGQKIEKNVGVVNTGNVDALVRTWLTGEMRVTSEARNTEKITGTTTKDFTKLTTSSEYDSGGTATTKIAGLTEVSDAKLKELGLTYSYTEGVNTYYLRELDKEHRYNNPTITTGSNQTTVGNNAYTEVEALQAGGVLAYTNNAAASFVFTPNQTINFTNAAGDQIYLEKGTPYTIVLSSGATDITQTTTTITATDVEMLSKYCGDNLDTDTFKPKTSGLYIFKRNVDLGSTDDYEFTGYYYVAKSGDTGAEGKFFALQYANDDSKRSSVAIEDTKYEYTDANNDGIYIFSPSKTSPADSVALYTAKQEVVENTNLTWNYFAKNTTYKKYTKDSAPTYYVDAANKVYDSLNDLKKGKVSTTITSLDQLTTASYTAGSNETLTSVPMLVAAKDDIIINIALADTVGNDAEQWTVIPTAGIPNDYKFYYNNDVEEGATTSKLVDSVELDNSVTQNAYVAFDFDLNVNMDSVQVTYDDDGKEDISAAKSSWAQINKTATVANYDSGSSEISSITWTNS